MTEMPKRTRTWVLDDPYRPPTPMVAHLAISIHIIYTLAQTKIRHSRINSLLPFADVVSVRVCVCVYTVSFPDTAIQIVICD